MSVSCTRVPIMRLTCFMQNHNISRSDFALNPIIPSQTRSLLIQVKSASTQILLARHWPRCFFSLWPCLPRPSSGAKFVQKVALSPAPIIYWVAWCLQVKRKAKNTRPSLEPSFTSDGPIRITPLCPRSAHSTLSHLQFQTKKHSTQTLALASAALLMAKKQLSQLVTVVFWVCSRFRCKHWYNASHSLSLL